MGGPDDKQKIMMFTYGLNLKVNVHPPSQSIGNDKEWWGKVVGPGVGVDPAFKVTVPREDTTTHQVIL